ncbi:hypothetical protein C8F04DRAFT_1196471, partial [Mycena alexandri]
VFHSSLELTIHRLCTTSTPPPGSLPRPLAMCLVLAIDTMTANSNLKRLSQGAKTSTSGWWLGAHGHCRVQFACIHVPCDGHPDAPTSTEIHTATGADRTLHAVKQACPLWPLVHPPPHLPRPHPPSASWTPPPSKVHTFLSRSTGHTHAIPISLSPPFNSPQGAPMRMRTSFPGSKCAHCKEVEVERRACAGETVHSGAAVKSIDRRSDQRSELSTQLTPITEANRVCEFGVVGQASRPSRVLLSSVIDKQTAN